MTTENKNSKRGFTLVELLVTISILAVLATVSVVGYVSFIEKANLARDKAIVDQLNQLKNAYAVSGDTSIDEIIRDSGLTFSEITPTSDGHKLYYDTEQNTFVLATDDEKTDNLQEINEEYFNSDTTPDDEDPKKENPEGTTQTPDDDPPENKFTFTLNTDYSYSGKNDTFIRVEDSKIVIGIHYDIDSPKLKEIPTINFNNIISATDNNGSTIEVSFTIEETNIFTYPGEEDKNSYTSNGSEITFNKAGLYNCIADGYDYKIEVQVINTYYNQASVSFTNTANVSIKSIGDGKYKIKGIHWKDIKVYDYDFTILNYSDMPISEYTDTPSVIAIIEINGEKIEIQMNNKGGEYNFEFNGEATQCTIKLKYLGANGEIVYSDAKTVTISAN